MRYCNFWTWRRTLLAFLTRYGIGGPPLYWLLSYLRQIPARGLPWLYIFQSSTILSLVAQGSTWSLPVLVIRKRSSLGGAKSPSSPMTPNVLRSLIQLVIATHFKMA